MKMAGLAETMVKFPSRLPQLIDKRQYVLGRACLWSLCRSLEGQDDASVGVSTRYAIVNGFSYTPPIGFSEKAGGTAGFLHCQQLAFEPTVQIDQSVEDLLKVFDCCIWR